MKKKSKKNGKLRGRSSHSSTITPEDLQQSLSLTLYYLYKHLLHHSWQNFPSHSYHQCRHSSLNHQYNHLQQEPEIGTSQPPTKPLWPPPPLLLHKSPSPNDHHQNRRTPSKNLPHHHTKGTSTIIRHFSFQRHLTQMPEKPKKIQLAIQTNPDYLINSSYLQLKSSTSISTTTISKPPPKLKISPPTGPKPTPKYSTSITDKHLFSEKKIPLPQPSSPHSAGTLAIGALGDASNIPTTAKRSHRHLAILKHHNNGYNKKQNTHNFYKSGI